MAQNNPYHYITVESYTPKNTCGMHGKVHIRPIEGEIFAQNLHIECSKKLSQDYPVGTKFKIKAKLTDRDNGKEYIYSNHKWSFEVL